jgi:hypothetical protein
MQPATPANKTILNDEHHRDDRRNLGKGNEKLPVINTNSAIFAVLLFCAEKNPTWPSGGTS